MLTVITQPVQIALNLQQKDPSLSILNSLRKAVYDIGPLKGVVPGVGREWLKGVYKAPVMKITQGTSHDLIEVALPGSMQGYKLLENVVAGIGSGLVDAGMSSVLERYKTYLTTSGKEAESFTT